MTKEILQLMKERRKVKNKDPLRYEYLNKEVKKRTTEAKEKR